MLRQKTKQTPVALGSTVRVRASVCEGYQHGEHTPAAARPPFNTASEMTDSLLTSPPPPSCNAYPPHPLHTKPHPPLSPPLPTPDPFWPLAKEQAVRARGAGGSPHKAMCLANKSTQFTERVQRREGERNATVIMAASRLCCCLAVPLKSLPSKSAVSRFDKLS